MNSREKGKRGELELAHILQKRGYSARRGQQFCGITGEADVVGLDGYHIECKRVENLNLDKAMQQSIRDAREEEVPIVVHRKNNKKWLVTISLDDFLDVLEMI